MHNTFSDVYEELLAFVSDVEFLAYEEPQRPYDRVMIKPQVLNKLGCPQPFPTGFT